VIVFGTEVEDCSLTDERDLSLDLLLDEELSSIV